MKQPTDLDEQPLRTTCIDCGDKLDKSEREYGVCRQCGSHVGDPCIYCGVTHDNVQPGPCAGK